MAEGGEIVGEGFSVIVDDSDFFCEQGEFPFEPVINQMLKTNSSNLMAVLYFEENFNEDLKNFNEIYRNQGVDAFLKPEFLVTALDIYVFNRLNGQKLLSLEEHRIFDELFEFSEKFIKGISFGNIDFLLFPYKKMKKLKDLCLRLIYMRQTLGLRRVFSKNNRFARAFDYIDYHLDDVLEKVYASLSV